MLGEAMKPKILFEDNHIIVVLKPPNMLTQGDRTGDENLLDYLKAYIKVKYEKPGNVFVGLVHRMDRPVGGLLVFARTSKAANRLAKQVKDRTIDREYICICKGNPPSQFTLRDFLYKDREKNKVCLVPSYLRKGKEAILHARTIRYIDDSALVAIRLETGRGHQIRAQMSGNGFPLLGDMRYGDMNEKGQIALWGIRLGFLHPITQQKMIFFSAPKFDGFWQNYWRDIEGLEGNWPVISPQYPYRGRA
jgi:23S rRNA pseudouridine1911/1915/1917 synthase